ncbi:PDZ domain-containing protein [Peribacillus cavernae]|uniref:C-terminal processing peptidase n=1 Tax=Peribacillus cavernae TaxID=1674310 RepID=A0A433HSU8_9BACI|nr:S41 family peptidase [Peribacillus cavernae]MDQ0218382.1 carboxyl-terminal processing protease [Peribacillus cavernae]RUQ31391.1 PDZ domain-containing protein [Peribacillus cavernae]
MSKKWVFPLVVVLSLSTGAAGGVFVTSQSQGDNFKQLLWGTENEANPDRKESVATDIKLEKVEQAYDLISHQYVEKVKKEQLVEGAIQGMLSTLKDPYSTYMNEETAKQFSQTLDSSFEGIGTEIGMEDGKIIIVAPYKDSPAEKAGLKPKDQLLKVNGESVEGLDLNETSLKIRGKKGSKITLEIKRAGASEPITLKVVRDEIPVETVYSSIKEENGENIGYIELTTFSEGTAADFKKQLKALEKKGIKGLVIDVRGNPGGLLSSVEKILGLFITKDKPYLQIAQRNGETQTFFTNLKEEKKYPVAVLTDKGSASAAEILAGALNEAGDYALIGEKTFGKGTVQQAVPMGDGSNIKLTLFKWLTPEGNWIHKKGIEPTIEVHQPDYFNAHPLQVDKTFKRDMTNGQIQHAQRMLKGLGFEPGRNDGYYDLKTEIAIKAFQQDQNLKVTGEIDQETAAKLEDAIIEKVRDEDNDVQLKTALLYIAKSSASMK